MIQISIIVLSLIAIVAAICAISFKKMSHSILSAGTVGLIASVIYLILGAPDVAMTEAAIGSGLTTVIFFFTLKKIKKGDRDD